MKLDFDKIYNAQKTKTGFVCGMGPSIKPYLKHISELSNQKDKNCFVSCNDWDTMIPDVNVDYWIFASNVYKIEDFYSRLNQKVNTTLVYADSVDLTDRNLVDKLLKIDYLPYDQRHFNGLNCQQLLSGRLRDLGGYDSAMNCCKNLVRGRKTIQEYLKDISQSEQHYGTGDSVAVHALALAVILGCNPIYIAGVDLDYSKGYVDNKTQNHDSFNPWMPRIINDFWQIKNSAEKLGIKIYNLSQESPLKDIFETKNYI